MKNFILFLICILLSFYSCKEKAQTKTKENVITEKKEVKKKSPKECVLDFEKQFLGTDKKAAETYTKLNELFLNYAKDNNEQNLKLLIEQIGLCKKVFEQTANEYEDIPVNLSLNEKLLQNLYSASGTASNAYKIKTKAMELAYDTFTKQKELSEEEQEEYPKKLKEGDYYLLQAWGYLEEAKKEVGLK